jgi:hypothetical protein
MDIANAWFILSVHWLRLIADAIDNDSIMKENATPNDPSIMIITLIYCYQVGIIQ